MNLAMEFVNYAKYMATLNRDKEVEDAYRSAIESYKVILEEVNLYNLGIKLKPEEEKYIERLYSKSVQMLEGIEAFKEEQASKGMLLEDSFLKLEADIAQNLLRKLYDYLSFDQKRYLWTIRDSINDAPQKPAENNLEKQGFFGKQEQAVKQSLVQLPQRNGWFNNHDDSANQQNDWIHNNDEPAKPRSLTSGQ
jgi:hypothetical protein